MHMAGKGRYIAADDLVSTVLDAAGIAALDADQWDALSLSAIDDNPFYARPYVLAGLATIDRSANLRALAVRHGVDGPLVGLFPYRLRRFPLARAAAAGNLFQFCGLPLIHRGFAAEVVEAWFAAMAARQIPRHWRFGDLDLSSGFARLCDPASRAHGLDLVPLNTYSRARLTACPGSFAAHSAMITKHRLKDIQRTLRRLGELGTISFERATDPAIVAERVEDYLRIEHQGWKGQGGTAFLNHARHAEFARQAFTRTGASQCSVDSLLLDGRPIALSINLQAGETMFTPKCTYDETYRKFSPGLALEYLVIEAFYERRDCRDMDAATTVEGHVVAGLWNEQKPMGSLVLGPRAWTTSSRAWLQRTLATTKRSLRSAASNNPVATVSRALRQRVKRFHDEVMLSGNLLGTAADHISKLAVGS